MESSRRHSPSPAVSASHLTGEGRGHEAIGPPQRAARPRGAARDEDEDEDEDRDWDGLLTADGARRAARRQLATESPALSVATAQDQELQNALRLLQRSRADALEQLQARGRIEMACSA